MYRIARHKSIGNQSKYKRPNINIKVGKEDIVRLKKSVLNDIIIETAFRIIYEDCSEERSKEGGMYSAGERPYDINDRFEFRDILPDEAGQAARIEEICFPPNEACSEKMMLERIAKAPELFLVAVDRESGRIAGFLNGLSTEEGKFRDEFFTDAMLYDPAGQNVMLLGLDVLPQYRGRGLAREIVARYLDRERERGRKAVFLTCLEDKVGMYEGMGFTDLGMAESSWGGEQWHEMRCEL